jgi:hypothetical protein
MLSDELASPAITRPPGKAASSMKRLTSGLLVPLVGVTLLLLGAGPAHPASDRAAKLLPDLKTMPPYGFEIEFDGQARLLRFGNEVANADVGVLEVFPVEGDCDGDGDPENDRFAYQQLYQDRNGNGKFDREADRKARPIQVGCFQFHLEHNHWHFENFARYQLERLSDGKVVKTSDKISFCIVDVVHRYPNIPGSPPSGFYHTCGKTSRTGISVGWSDLYGPLVEGQSLDITSLEDGQYCYVSTVDPKNLLRESDDANNAASTLLEISGESVVDLRTTC